MEVSNVLEIVLKPFLFPITPGQRIYFVYLGTALILAFAVYLSFHARRDEGVVRGFLAYCFPKSIYGHKSTLVDLKYFVINKISFGIIFGPMLLGSGVTARWTASNLELISGRPGLGWEAGAAAPLLLTALAILAMDGAIFVVHWLLHRVPALWEFHKVHHSAETLTPITVYRVHPVDDLLYGTVIGLIVGVIHGTFDFLYGDDIRSITVLRLNIVLFVFYVTGYNLRHSHIWLSYPRAISHVLVSPAQHQIHHSLDPRHYDKNYGFILAFWDWLIGSLYVPRHREELSYGLADGEHREYDRVWRLYLLPLKKAAAHLTPGLEDRKMRKMSVVGLGLLLGVGLGWSWLNFGPPAGKGQDGNVYMEQLTWVEVRSLIEQGKTTVIVPTAGNEQNGPHMVLGKHNYIVRYTAGRIAAELGNALVAPVVTFVPEGRIDPPEGHMAFAGTISVPDQVFADILEYTARSLRAHGFKTICFLGDSFGNQRPQAEVANKLNAEWAGTDVTVLHVGDYYDSNGQMAWLLSQGESEASVGYHAGIRDTSELMAVFPGGIRHDLIRPNVGPNRRRTGVNGDPTRASAERGRALLKLKVDAALRQIRTAPEDSGT